ncbi:hypothetical protein TURU_086446 [Turdus rufiventris]|nr:hypothetical protein TURU_086446 [Turdus rufiventris]
MTVATMAIEVRALDMALDSFDDQYQNSSHAMEEAFLALKHSDFQNNSLFMKYSPWAVSMGPSRWSPVSHLSSSDQATAIMACHIIYLYKEFINAREVAGHSHQAYWAKFQILLNDTFTMLMAARKEQKPCCVIQRVHNYKSKENVDDIAREVPIPHFEKFKVTKVVRGGENKRIHLEYIETCSKYNCELLTDRAVGPVCWRPVGQDPPMAPPDTLSPHVTPTALDEPMTQPGTTWNPLTPHGSHLSWDT